MGAVVDKIVKISDWNHYFVAEVPRRPNLRHHSHHNGRKRSPRPGGLRRGVKRSHPASYPAPWQPAVSQDHQLLHRQHLKAGFWPQEERWHPDPRGKGGDGKRAQNRHLRRTAKRRGRSRRLAAVRRPPSRYPRPEGRTERRRGKRAAPRRRPEPQPPDQRRGTRGGQTDAVAGLGLLHPLLRSSVVRLVTRRQHLGREEKRKKASHRMSSSVRKKTLQPPRRP